MINPLPVENSSIKVYLFKYVFLKFGHGSMILTYKKQWQLFFMSMIKGHALSLVCFQQDYKWKRAIYLKMGPWPIFKWKR